MDYNNPLSPWNQRHYNDKMYDDLTYEEKMKAGCLHLFFVILMFFVGIVVCLLLGSCTTTKYVTVPEYHTDTLYQNHVLHDSIHVRDSVYFKEYTKGDTVYQEKTRWMTEWRERLKTDTIYKAKTDSVSVPFPIEVKVPAELSKWQSFRIVLGDIVLFLIAAVGGYFILKKIKS